MYKNLQSTGDTALLLGIYLTAPPNSSCMVAQLPDGRVNDR